MIYKIADLKVKFNNRYAFTDAFCKDYLCSERDFDIEATVSEADILKEKTLSPSVTDGYAENICLYRSLCGRLPYFDRFLLHSSVVEYNGKCYAFCGKSGAGKSTHSRLWLKNLPNAKILNGDKPIVYSNGFSFIVYGTPWRGKEGLGYNGKTELKGICFLEQSLKNDITKLTFKESARRIIDQVYFPNEASAVEKTLDFCDSIITNIPCYLLCCDVSDEAFSLSFNAFEGGLADE